MKSNCVAPLSTAGIGVPVGLYGSIAREAAGVAQSAHDEA